MFRGYAVPRCLLSAMGGIIAVRILPGYGWRALLVVIGAAPLLLAPLLAAVLPKSVRYLVMSVFLRIAPDLKCSKFVDATASNVSPVRELFCGGLFLGTLRFG